ncbi:mannose-6-phosphate isomerase, class I [Paenibacillus sp. MMS18-CY102]|uniref:mannose-6-phosphate isomerase, class I n=1 Tax=Paenibacillus sp. MMS18-CY102 TaxID=2682849 RepID=UPI001365975F|nr:mannose-6-phosphate isomerase, class I [Paenibacillus sp. MMS18-CY102]MWC27656.1 mannose-6-phosphate isomerase, class I [Paenibacillus sp. MMS18-CY102]
MNQPIFLQSVFQERIWGGTKLKQLFNYNIPNERTGEYWAVSAHPNGQSIVSNGTYQGMKLGELWTAHPELFRSNSAVFPLLTKILDASDDLSVQVHPNDEYAGKHENGELGKTECWYIVDAEPGATIIFGHEATSKEQLVQMVQDGQWNALLTQVPVKAGDFFYVPSGTIHALGKGIVVLETQQSSDTTYRVYDYDRRDKDGNLRELHLDKAIDVTTIPQSYVPVPYSTRESEGITVTAFVSNEFFTVEKWNVSGVAQLPASEKYTIASVIEGSGTLRMQGEEYALKPGDHFILPVAFGPYCLEGSLELIISQE